MASDYGDEAGSKMIDDFMRFGERMGERAMYARAAQMQKAFRNATRSAQELSGDHAPGGDAPEWAKLDMAEFQEIEDYAGIKGIIEAKLRAHAVDSAWFVEPATGREHLLFRVADARQARAAPSALEAEGATTRAATRGPRMQEVRAR